jgi:hypothetical protein
MERSAILRLLSSLAVAAVVAAAIGSPVIARATGTAIVQQSDGSIKTYGDVSVRLARQELALTSSDGAGTLVIAKAACNHEGALLKCLPYDATLFQYGKKTHISLNNGTIWLNPTATKQHLPSSSSALPPHGVMISTRTKSGTYLSFIGKVDQVQK